MNENTESNPPTSNEFSTVVQAVKIVILAVILIPVAKYVLVNNDDSPENVTVAANFEQVAQNVSYSDETEMAETVVPEQVKQHVIVQPSCSRSFMLTMLMDLCEELVIRSEFCVPSDLHDEKKHRIPERMRNTQPKEAKGTGWAYAT